jgi:Tol biopolymer transport system component
MRRVLICLSAVAACGVLAAPANGAVSTSTKIVYQRAYSSQATFLWTMNGDGSGQKRITPSGVKGADAFAAWSPDKRRISFYHRDPDRSKSGFYVSKADGTKRKRLVATTAANAYSDWTSNGKLILFSANNTLETIRPDGSGRTSIGAFDAEVVRWGPDDKSILMEHQPPEDNVSHIAIRGSDGQLTDLGRGEHPDWSPNGKLISYAGYPGPVETARSSIVLVAPNGSGQKVIFTVPSREYSIESTAFSPDGKKILFTYDKGGTSQDLYSVGVNGKGLKQLTKNKPIERLGDW